MREPRAFAAASMTEEGDMMVTGGTDDKGIVHSSTTIFHNGAWEEGLEMPVKMYGHCQVTSKLGVIVAGGFLDKIKEKWTIYFL